MLGNLQALYKVKYLAQIERMHQIDHDEAFRFDLESSTIDIIAIYANDLVDSVFAPNARPASAPTTHIKHRLRRESWEQRGNECSSRSDSTAVHVIKKQIIVSQCSPLAHVQFGSSRRRQQSG